MKIIWYEIIAKWISHSEFLLLHLYLKQKKGYMNGMVGNAVICKQAGY
jgi:hypothetical protein